jgi:ribosomal protein L32
MDQTTQLLALVVAASIGILSTLVILRRQRRDTEAADRSSPYAVSTEGMKRCPNCGVGNLVTDRDCSACGRRLPG